MKSIDYMIKWTLPATLGITIICFAVLSTLSFKGLYYKEINYLSIPEHTNISQNEIKENYDVLIDYLTDKDVDKLSFPSFEMSKEGEIHFVDVKNIFILLKNIMYILGLYSLIGILINISKKKYKFLKHTVIGVIAVPASILLATMINFDKVFILFHNIAFSNDYWIFDPVLDPVITILPQEFFMHSLLLIISIVLVIAIILTMIYITIKKLDGGKYYGND